MTRYEAFLRCLAAGDPDSALSIWRSKQWDDHDRAKAVRLLTAATTVRLEVIP